MSKYIILEGPENSGKSTQVKNLIENLSHLQFHKLHYSSLPFKNDTKKCQEYSLKLYSNMFKMLKELKTKDVNFILDRSHLGESVYSPLYRGYSGDYVFELESKYVDKLRDELYLITLVNDVDTLYDRNDGKSLYENKEQLSAEINGFEIAHRKSNIKNKLLINTSNMNPIQIRNIILDFIKTASTTNEELQKINQLSLNI